MIKHFFLKMNPQISSTYKQEISHFFFTLTYKKYLKILVIATTKVNVDYYWEIMQQETKKKHRSRL